MNQLIQMVGDFSGSGFLFVLYLLSLLYLFLREKKTEYRLFFVYVPLGVLLLFANPLLASFFTKYADAEIYYRLLWLLPISVTILYAGISLVRRAPEKKRGVLLAALLLVLLFSGRLLYADSNIRPAENIYHMPDAVVDICEEIVIPGREVMAAFPSELVQYVRQYSPLVCMPYGRENLVGRWEYGYHPLSSALNAEQVNAETIAALAHSYYCHYLIFRPGTEVVGDLSAYGFVYDKTVDGYLIYRSTIADFHV